MIGTMQPARGLELKSSQFRRERESAWRDLERLVTWAEARGLRSLTASELHQLPSLLRGAASSLSVARAISLDKNLLAYLNALVCRAHLTVYSTKQRVGEALAAFFTRQLPRTVRRNLPWVAAAWALLLLGVLTGYCLTRADPDSFYNLVDDHLAHGRTPSASTAELRAALYDRQGGWSSLLPLFASLLFANNTRVGLLCFGLGFAAGAPVVFLLFSNGLTLGALAALYASRGLGFEFWAWVLPHGFTELGAVCLCGAGGLAIGGALLFPGRRTRLEAVARRGREAALLAAGAVVMLFAAGLIEGIFRQLVQDVLLRSVLAFSSLLFWLWYFLFAGAAGEAAHDR
jgi:uncharacterized membrane protein SpoIIM required for sporulation